MATSEPLLANNDPALSELQYKSVCIYIFIGLILMVWHMERHINPQTNRRIIMDPAGIELTTSRLRQHHQLPVV